MLQLARALSFLVLALPWLGGFSAYVFDEQVCNDFARKEQSYSSTYSASGGGNQSGTYTANITTVPLYCYDTVSKTWTQNILDSCWRNHTPWDVAKVPLADSYCLPNVRSCRLYFGHAESALAPACRDARDALDCAGLRRCGKGGGPAVADMPVRCDRCSADCRAQVPATG